jgi:hypothetical protein
VTEEGFVTQESARVTVMHTLLIALLLGEVAAAQSRPGEWITMTPGDFCVTEGRLEKGPGDRLSVNVPKLRAYVSRATASSAEVQFRYVGPTNQEAKLGSGQVRTQFGLKLRAQDPCNLVYVMWRIEPESKLVVSLKRNPSEHTSAQCRNRGYTNIKPRKASPMPRLEAGQSHTLRAEMKDQELRVFVDNKEIWEGDLGSDAARLQGPVGIRTDNAQLEFSYLARRPDGNIPDHGVACKSGDSD